MTTITAILPEDMHRLCARALYDRCWEQARRTDRSAEDDQALLNMAHASLWHWRVVGLPVNLARGEWMLARVNALLGLAESARHHAENSLALCDAHQLPEHDRALAHEAIARACAIGSEPEGVASHVQYGLAAAGAVPDPSEREWVLRNLGSVTTDPPLD